MDITFMDVTALLLARGVDRDTFNAKSLKTYDDLQGENERHEVRFILSQDGKIVCLRRSSLVLAQSRKYRYIQVACLYLKGGVWVPDTTVRGCTYSETARWGKPEDPRDLGEDPVDAAVWGAFEECGARVKRTDFRRAHLRTWTNDSILQRPRPSRVYHALHSLTIPTLLKISPVKLGLRREWTELKDGHAKRSIIRRIPVLHTKQHTGCNNLA
ncbi:MAG: hypothetical protein WDN10_01080 [bacterium]